VADAVLRLENLRKRFGQLVVTDDVTLEVGPDEIHAVIGPNGAGKTSLINQISGLLSPDGGRIIFADAEITRWPAAARAAHGLARSFQITSILPGFSVLENVALAVQARSGSSFRFFGRAGDERSLNGPALAALAQVGLVDRAQLKAEHLSHGEKRALELAIALAMQPRLLLLDEPMAGMGREESHRLTGLLRRFKGTFAMLLVEHDMTAVFALADRVSVMVHGRVMASGTPEEVRADPQVVSAYLGEGA
jgi:branched-chain amino acid transport system ATP-binding protein